MRTKFLPLLTFLFAISWSPAQVTMLNESFTAPFNASASGWLIQNNSNPLGTSTWAQGAGTVFTAYSGGANDYICANYNSQGTTFGSISNFLITPTVSLMNGGVLKFVTRTTVSPSNFPDRMEVRMSIGTGTGNIANNVSAVGTFTSLITTINPNLLGVGYPGIWTVYTFSLSGITGTVPGRFAFRYDVYDGGLNGANSNYIGLDNVEYTTGGPCPPAPVTISPSNTTICQGMGGVTLQGGGASSYTWIPSQSHNSYLSVNPNVTTVYTLSGSSSSTCPGQATATVTVVYPPNLTAPNVTACPGGTVLLSASGANTYTWSNGAVGPTVVVTATSSFTYYSVQGETAPGCSDFTSVSVTTNTFLNVSDPAPVACPNQTLILGASGALTYTWSSGATSPSIVVTPTANATYFVSGNDGNCTETKYISITIDPNMFAPSFTTCAGTPATLFVSGANSYMWSTGATASIVVVTPTANTVYTVTGFSGSCSQVKTVSVNIGNNLSVNCSQVCLGTSVLLSAYGASSYTWLPINDNNASVIFTPTAVTVFTLIGTSGTCSGSKTIQVTYCAGAGETMDSQEEFKAYPNPFRDEISIRCTEGVVKIVNLNGQVLFHEKVVDEIKLSTGEFSPGLYFIIFSNSDSVTRKVIKLIKDN